MKKTSLKRIWEIYFYFYRISWFTFGGGWSIVAQMQKDFVDDKKELTAEELLDIVSVGRSLPGTMIGNVAMLYGYRVAGIAGGMACLFGMILPPMAVLAVITQFYTAFQHNLWVAAAMRGIRAAVVPIMISAVLGMVGSAFRFPPCYAVMLLVIALYLFWGVNCVYLVIIGAVCGLLIAEFYERKGAKKHDGAA